MVRNTSVSNLIVQQKSQKTVDQANTKIQRFTRFMDRIMTKNDPPSDSKVDKAEKFVADRTKGNKDPNTSNFMTDMLYLVVFLCCLFFLQEEPKQMK